VSRDPGSPSLYRAQAVIGTVQDVTLHELMIESLSPASDVTACLDRNRDANGRLGGA
jgi:hypothetical protein